MHPDQPEQHSAAVYEARRARALVLLFDILFAMTIGLVLFSGDVDNPRTGPRADRQVASIDDPGGR